MTIFFQFKSKVAFLKTLTLNLQLKDVSYFEGKLHDVLFDVLYMI